MTKPRPGEKVEEKEKALQMMLSGEREIVNIMADTALGATTVKNVWAMGRAKGLISKKDRLRGTGLKRVIKNKTAGETVKRLSGRPFVTQTIDPVPKARALSPNREWTGRDLNPRPSQCQCDILPS